MVDITRWLEAIKLKPFYLFALFSVCLAIIFLPSSWAEQLGIAAIRRDYRSWFGLAGVAALVLWCLHGVVWIGSQVERKWKRMQHRRGLADELRALSPGEWRILIACVRNGQKTLFVSVIDPYAQALANKGLVWLALGEGSKFNWPVTVVDDVWRHLHDPPELVNEAEGEVRRFLERG